MHRNKFTIIFQKKEQYVDLDYILHDTEIANQWYKKVKHLKKIPIDDIESRGTNLSDLENIYKDFCEFANIDYTPIEKSNQEILNKLHQLFEINHNSLSKRQNNQILYKFHHAIHSVEKRIVPNDYYTVGWGVKEGPLTTEFKCNSVYEKDLKKNAIYLPWSELGKTPLTYWFNKEPNDHRRFLELCKPHITLRAKFMIMLQDRKPKPLPQEFVNWFEKHKKPWLQKNNLQEWRSIDEYCAPLLAVPCHNNNLDELVQSGYQFKQII